MHPKDPRNSFPPTTRQQSFSWFHGWLLHSFIGFKSIFKTRSFHPGLTGRVVLYRWCLFVRSKLYIWQNVSLLVLDDKYTEKRVRAKLVCSGCIYQRKSWAQDQDLVTPLISPNPAPDHIADFHLFLNIVRSTIRGGVSVQQRVFFFTITWKKRIS